MPNIKVEHVHAKGIIRKLQDKEIPFTIKSDSSKAQYTMPTYHRAGTFGMGVMTTIKVRSEDAELFEKICREVLKARTEQEVPPIKPLREIWPFKMFTRKKR